MLFYFWAAMITIFEIFLNYWVNCKKRTYDDKKKQSSNET